MSSPIPADRIEDLVRTLRAAGCVFAEQEADLLLNAAGGATDLAELVQRRVGGEPLEYVLGWAEFCGQRVAVESGVFVPRHRTEFLVELAIELARRNPRASSPATGVVVLDLCCGTGAIGVALLAALDRVELHAADIDPAAVRCAQRNIGSAGRTYLGNRFEPLPVGLRGRVQILAANVPYVPTEAICLMPPEARLYEARAALDGGGDGLGVLRQVSEVAARWLAPAGHLLVETSERQAPLAAEIFAGSGLTAAIVKSDEWGATVVIGSHPNGGRP